VTSFLRLAAAVALLNLLGLLSQPATASEDTSPPVQISDAGPDPSPCTPTAGIGEVSAAGIALTPTRGKNKEPAVAANPTRPGHLVAAWMVNGGTGVETAWSADDGRSWHRVLVPGLSTCNGTTVDQISDPWVSFGVDGVAYLSAKPGNALGTVSTVVVTTSRDGGATWAPFVEVQPYDGLFNDKPMVVADATRGGTAYVTWAAAAGPAVNADDAIMVSRTVDGGTTWTAPAIERLSPPGVREVPHLLAFSDGSIENLIVSGSVRERGSEAGAGSTEHEVVLASRSTDEGATWSKPQAITTDLASVVDGHTCASAIFAATSVGSDGWIAYNDAAPGSTQPGKIMLAHSTDDGRTWGTSHAAVAGQTPFCPMLGATERTVTLGFFDLRNDAKGDDALVAHLWARTSVDGGTTWAETHLDGPFDIHGVDLGDYQMASQGGGRVGLVYSRPSATKETGPSDIKFAAVPSSTRLTRPAPVLPRTGRVVPALPASALLLVGIVLRLSAELTLRKRSARRS
jgi:hypothetical protein